MNKKQKFNQQGVMQQFPGNTIVSPLAYDKKVVYLFKEIQSIYRNLPFSDKYVFLPEASVHMTVFELLCHYNRRPSYWSDDVALDASLEKIDSYFHRQLEKVTFPDAFKMKPCHIRNTVIALEPFDKETTQLLDAFRNALANVTGVRFPNHKTYQFHISFGYKVQDLTPSEERYIRDVQADIQESILSQVEAITIDQIEYTVFENMARFIPYDEGAREALKHEFGYQS